MNLNKSILSAAIITAVSSFSATAEETAEKQVKEIETIQVTGIRGSLVRSLFDKRSADSVVDGISAEDIGKFPDQNVAESLQRITGVTIDRGESGEGQKISIRGFGPQFNNVLFNGRTMPTDNNARGFSFDLIAAELVSGADVYKTMKADVVEGGLGGTVNVHTARPFDFDGFKGAASAKVVQDTLADSSNPYVSGLISQNFDSDFGILASFAYQQRDSRMDQAGSLRFRPSNVLLGDEGTAATEEQYWRPQTSFQKYELADRERLGATLVGQWQASDDLRITADVLYSAYSAQKESYEIGRWYSDPQFNAVVDDNGSVVEFDRSVKPYVAPGVHQLWEDGNKLPTGQWNGINYKGLDRDSDTTMFGLNFDWDVSDTFNVEVDLHTSKADSRSPNNPYINLSVGTLESAQWEDTGNSFNWEDDSEGYIGDLNNYHTGNVYQVSEATDDDVTELRIDTQWELEDTGVLTSISSGIHYSDRTKSYDRGETPWTDVVVGFYGGYVANVPSDIFYDVAPSGGFLSDHNTGGFIDNWVSFDPDDVFDYLVSDEARQSASHVGDQIMNNFANGDPTYANEAEAQAAADAASAAKLANIEAGFAKYTGEYGPYTPVHLPAKSWEVNEETLSAYVQASLEGENWSGNVGLRYVTTDTTSYSANEVFIGMRLLPGQGAYAKESESGQISVGKGSYSQLLPSLNVKYDITEDIVTRFAYSKTLTRPSLSQLILGETISAVGTDSAVAGQVDWDLKATGQNPDLKPYISDNIDVAIEWYYAPESYIGATYFSKDLSDWIVTETVDEERYDSIQEVNLTFQRTAPRNVESAEVSGIELAMLHNFESGFGIQLNYTMIDTTAASSAGSDSRVSMTGLSDSSYNVIGFYENGAFQARVAYNWREGYTTCTSCSWGDPELIDDYGQVDASASYDVTETVSIFADVTNLLDEDPYKYAKYKNRTESITDTGVRYSVGVRASF
ncbi:TonB-dependent receptor [Colwellia sp. 20A7]|uniref:TonB-dependent receptor n=1 Tax=Colwellia sp. 20A7 TaxID=2689569 RepID=UPI001359B8DD|nr:TonB-dependent receptor [Colwellia sp. 20A7]